MKTAEVIFLSVVSHFESTNDLGLTVGLRTIRLSNSSITIHDPRTRIVSSRRKAPSPAPLQDTQCRFETQNIESKKVLPMPRGCQDRDTGTGHRNAQKEMSVRPKNNTRNNIVTNARPNYIDNAYLLDVHATHGNRQQFTQLGNTFSLSGRNCIFPKWKPQRPAVRYHSTFTIEQY